MKKKKIVKKRKQKADPLMISDILVGRVRRFFPDAHVVYEGPRLSRKEAVELFRGLEVSCPCDGCRDVRAQIKEIDREEKRGSQTEFPSGRN